MDNNGFLREVPKEVLLNEEESGAQMIEIVCPHCGKEVKVNAQAQIILCPNTQCRKLISLVS